MSCVSYLYIYRVFLIYLILFYSAHAIAEVTAQNKVFVYEPYLISQLAELISPENNVDPVSFGIIHNPPKKKTHFFCVGHSNLCTLCFGRYYKTQK